MDNSFSSGSKEDQFSVLEIDGIMLAFLKDEILSIEDLSKLSDLKYTEQMSAILKYAGTDLPVYTLNRDLMFKQKQANENRTCVVIKHPDAVESFALLCKTVNQLTIEESANVVPMPSIMKQNDSPLIALAKWGEQLLLISSARAMKSFISFHEMAPRLEVKNV